MIIVLVDTNVYLRLAKRVRPLLGIPFGEENYTITILKDVEDEVHRSDKLSYYNPWFDDEELAKERLAKRIRLSPEEKISLDAAQSILHNSVKGDIRYLTDGRHPPSPTDCRVLAFSQIRTSIAVTDDLGMHILANDFGITIWHGYELLEKLWKVEVVTEDLIREVFAALENNRDMTKSWQNSKHTTFVDVFGPPAPSSNQR